MKLISLIFFSLLGIQVLTQEYIVSKATIEILHPKGFKVSIPDDGKIKLFAFHGKVNEEFNGREAGMFSRDITVSQNGRWTFIDKKTTFKEGDTIYYWLYVIHKNGLGYLREDEHYKVTMLTQEYIVPKATIEILHPKGFKVSIPDDGKIKLFAFHGKINEEFNGLEAGMFASDILLSRNERWTFTDKKTTFKEGDIIYYWLYVIHKNGLGYLREDEHYTVTILTREYIVPEATIEILHPKGFKVSIPDDGNIKLFAFHGKINEEFNGLEAGMFASDILLSRNERWTFTDKKTTFKEGDIIYYWLYVIHKNGLGYLREDEHYTVTNPVKPSKPKPEGPITASLTNSELQRYVLLEQLDLIRLQKLSLSNKMRSFPSPKDSHRVAPNSGLILL